MRRVVKAELLDSDAGTAEEIESALRDLRMINRYFGGMSTTASLLRKIAERSGQRELAVLDVAAGPGESALGAAKQLAREGIRLRVTLTDRALSHLPRHGTRRVVGDALHLPFADSSFDVATSCLFLHHLEPEQVVRHINEALRVSRVAAVINDLNRSAMHLAMVYAGYAIYRSRLTRHDAVVSVRRAYTTGELREIFGQTNAATVDISRHFFHRIGAVAWKRTL